MYIFQLLPEPALVRWNFIIASILVLIPISDRKVKLEPFIKST